VPIGFELHPAGELREKLDVRLLRPIESVFLSPRSQEFGFSQDSMRSMHVTRSVRPRDAGTD